MTSLLSSFLHHSANTIESLTSTPDQRKRNNNPPEILSKSTSTPVPTTTTTGGSSHYYYQQPHQYNSTEPIPTASFLPPPPYDTMQKATPPTPTPSTSWTSDMSALAEKIRDEVTNSLKGNNTNLSKQQLQQQVNLDRHSISQGMKLVSIAADEYEGGNESTALEIYLTGIDKIIMALPNKTDANTRMAIRDKLASVEERVGILNLSRKYPHNKLQDTNNSNILDECNTNNNNSSSYSAIPVVSFLLSKLTSTISSMISRAYQPSNSNQEVVVVVDNKRIHTPLNSTLTVAETGQGVNGDPMTRFKRFGQCVIDVAVSFAVLIKQSPIPDIVALLFGYMLQLFMWIDAHYHVTEKVQDVGIQCIKFGLKTDEQYRLHEFLSEALYMLVAAGLKAAIAFKETPRYNSHGDNIGENNNTSHHHTTQHHHHQQQQQQQQQQQRVIYQSETRYIDNNITECLPATTQKTQSSWLWSS